MTYCRHYSRAPQGRRVDQTVPLQGGSNVTLIAALTPNGLGALLSVNGTVNGDVFAVYLGQVLDPTLVPDDVGVLDNLSVHKVAGLDQVMKNTGRSCTCPRIYPILTRLSWSSANLEPGCARPRPAPVACWKKPFGRL